MSFSSSACSSSPPCPAPLSPHLLILPLLLLEFLILHVGQGDKAGKELEAEEESSRKKEERYSPFLTPFQRDRPQLSPPASLSLPSSPTWWSIIEWEELEEEDAVEKKEEEKNIPFLFPFQGRCRNRSLRSMTIIFGCYTFAFVVIREKKKNQKRKMPEKKEEEKKYALFSNLIVIDNCRLCCRWICSLLQPT